MAATFLTLWPLFPLSCRRGNLKELPPGPIRSRSTIIRSTALSETKAPSSWTGCRKIMAISTFQRLFPPKTRFRNLRFKPTIWDPNGDDLPGCHEPHHQIRNQPDSRRSLRILAEQGAERQHFLQQQGRNSRGAFHAESIW